MRLAPFYYTIISIFLVSCADISSSPPNPADTAAKKENLADYWTQAKVNDCLADTDQAKYIKDRTELIDARIRSINLVYDGYLASLESHQKAMDLTTDTAVLGLSALGAIGSPTFNSLTLKVFAGTASLITGLKGKWDAETYYNHTLPILEKTMNQARNVVLTDIRDKEADPNVSLNRLLDEVDSYFQAGTIRAAINILGLTDVTQPQTTPPTTPPGTGGPGAAPPPGRSGSTGRSPVQTYFNL